MMDEKATEQHRWLQRLVGEWTSEAECVMGPDQPTMTMRGRESIRPLGEFWVIGTGQGEMPGGGTGHTVITLGYDVARGRFTGNFVGSMMTMMWLYDGELDAGGTVLTLDSEGPDMGTPGRSAHYQDIIEVPSADQRIMRSRMKDAEGNWQSVMTARYRRVG